MSHWRELLDPGSRGGRYLPWKEVGRATGLSRTTAWRLQKRGEFPAPYLISPGRVGYREDEVEAWRISRDHSGPRRGPRTATPETPPAPRRPGVPPRSERHVRSPEAVAPVEPGAPVTPPPAHRTAIAELSAQCGKPSRRRSQHAQAIAQQILFDF